MVVPRRVSGIVAGTSLSLVWLASVAAAVLAGVLAWAVDSEQEWLRIGAWVWVLGAASLWAEMVSMIAIALRRHGLAWATGLLGAGLAFRVLSEEYVVYASKRGPLAGLPVEWVALVGELAIPAILLAAPFFLLFANARARSSAWRRFALLPLALSVSSLTLIGLHPGRLLTAAGVANPIGVDLLEGTRTLALWLGLSAAVLVLLAAFVALRRERPEEAGEEELTPAKRRKREKRRRKTQGPRYAFDFFKDLPLVWPYLRPYWPLAAVSIALLGIGILVGLVAPWPLAILIDTVLGTKPVPSLLGFLGGWDRTDLLILAVVFGLLVAAFEGGVGVIESYVLTRLEQRMVLDVRSDLFQHASRLSQAFHDKRKTGGLMFAINSQASALGAVVVAMPPLAQAVGTLIGMFLITFMIDRELALIALSVTPFIYLSTGYYTKRIEPRLYHVRELEASSMSIVYEAMAMLRVIVSFGREKYEHTKFRTQAEEAVAARIDVTVRQTLFNLAVSVLTAAGTALVLGIGAWHVLRGQLTAGELLIVMGYIAAVYLPLQQISATIATLQEQFISLRGALDLLAKEPDIQEAPDVVRIGRANGHVTFEKVTFRHSGRKKTLERISFDAPPGTRVGIVGPTGAGKTTLVSLIPRLYDVKRGRVLIDGVDVRDVSLASLRAQISVVHQEPLLFALSIEENIRYGRLDATEEEIVEAAKAAHAHEFVSALPDGYATELGEGGALLSLGERQRIAIARAFLKNAPVLILDEPTASIDSRTERVILDALSRLAEGRTTFTIAHRLPTLGQADLILVLDDGELVEQGTHGELLAAGGLYAEMYEAQTGRAGLDADRGGSLVDPRLAATTDPSQLAQALRALLDAPPETLDWLATESTEPLEIRLAAGMLGVLSREDVHRLRKLRDEDLVALLEGVRR